MPNKKNEALGTTHIGWLTSATEGGEGMDHLVMGGSWKPLASKDSQPIVKFLEETPQTEAKCKPSFREADGTTLESPPEVWGSNGNEDKTSTQPLIILDEKSLGDSTETIFS